MSETEPLYHAIRARLDAAVTASGLTVAEIEQRRGLKRDRLRDFLAGRKRSIGFADVVVVAAELGVALDYLAGEAARAG